MECTFLHASFNEEKRSVSLWCKDANNAYVEVQYPYTPVCFVSLSEKQLTAVGLTGTPTHRTWGVEKRSGFTVEQHTINEELFSVLIANNQLYEHDIEPVRRFLISHNLTTGVQFTAAGELSDGTFIATSLDLSSEKKTDLTLFAFDIETYSPGFSIGPDKYPIVSIGVYSLEKKCVFTYGVAPRDDLVVCRDEEDMLRQFLAAVESVRPDILVGFNSDRFDMWYIAKRAMAMDWDLTLAGKPLFVRDSSLKRITSVPGPLLLDLYPFCRSALRTTLKTNSYGLDPISKEVLGDTKQPIDLSRLTSVWDAKSDEIYEYFSYNLHDAKLTYDLCDTFLANMLVFAELITLDLHDLTRMGFAQLVEHFLITRAHEQKQLVPPFPDADELRRRDAFINKGGYVHEPQPGLYKDVVVADFSSLYPSIIVSHNLDPAFSEEYSGDVIGFIPATIKELIMKRNDVKKELKSITRNDPSFLVVDARSQNLKVLANAMYGYLSFNQSRWHSELVAGKITSHGRNYVRSSLELTKEAGYTILYGDTDSIFFTLGDRSKEDALTHIEQLNSTLPGIMNLEVEGFFPAGIFVSARGGGGAKKRYALLREDESMKIVGFETVRNDWSLFAREVQKELLLLILQHKDTRVIEDFVAKNVSLLRERTVPLEKLIIRVKMTKSLNQYKSKSPHTAVAQRMINQSLPVKAGTVVSYVITQGSGPLYERARIPSEVNMSSIDPTYYIEHQLKPVVSSLLDVLGLGFPGETRQKGLGDF